MQLHLSLLVTERAERSDGTALITLRDAANTIAMVVLETIEQPYEIGAHYEIALTPLGPPAPRQAPRLALVQPPSAS